MPIVLRPDQFDLKQQVYHAWNGGQRNVLAVLPTGGGKCLGRDTPVLMYDGTVRMSQNIAVGDVLIGPDSTPRVVIATMSGEDELFAARPTKGDPYTVNSRHLLSLRRTNEKSNPCYPSQMRGGEIVNIPVTEYLAQSKWFKHIHKGWRTSVDFPAGAPLLIEPYMLGLWLGDGTRRNTAITTEDWEVMGYVIVHAHRNNLRLRFESKSETHALNIHSVSLQRGDGNSHFYAALRSYGLEQEKHIPLDFKRGTTAQRLELLAGLIDTDGHYTGKGYDITLKSQGLLDDLIFVARSLGFAAYKTECEKTCTNNGVTGTYYRCNISGDVDLIPVRIPRKKAAARRQKKNVSNTGLTVQPIGRGEYFGFQLIGRDHLFLLGDFTVTHNSVIVSDVVLDRHMQGATQAVIAHRTELVGQMSLHVARRGIRHRIIGSATTVASIIREHRAEFNGQSFVNPDANCTVASVDTLIARQVTLAQWAAQVDDWTIDECFPAGTMITTPTGARPIESIGVGQVVIAFDENIGVFAPRKVRTLFKNPAPRTMFDISINGANVRCTPGHPFWTNRGWVAAKDLTNDDCLFVHMHGMQQSLQHGKAVSELHLSQDGSGVLFNEVRHDVQGSTSQTPRTQAANNENLSDLLDGTHTSPRKDMLAGMRCSNTFCDDGSHQSQICFCSNDRKQSDEERGGERASFCVTESPQSPTIGAGWERQADTGCGTGAETHVRTARFCASTRNSNRCAQGARCSPGLQTGHGSSNAQDRSRSGRQKSQCVVAPATGCDERCVFAMQRVETITLYQPGDFDKSGGGYVYNIEVDDLHTYVANDIVVHNCHHVLRANKWGKAVSMFPNARGLGVTATPKRADGMGLGSHHDGVFDTMCCGPSMRELIEIGALCDYEIAVPESDFHIDDDDVAPSGDWSPRKMREASKRSHIVGDVVVEYQRRAMGKRGICFATDVETAVEMAQRFNDAGIPTAAVSAKTPSETRNEYIRRFRDGRLWMLVNVDLFGEGFDVPAVEVVIMARPTASLAVYLQQFGRALRVLAGKPFGLVIDHVSNWKRHGFPDKPHVWSLDRREKRAKREPDPEDIPLTACRGCSRPYERALTACPYCGFVPSAPEGGARSLEQVDGDLMLLTLEKLAELRAAMTLESPAATQERVAAVAGPIAGRGALNRAVERHQAQQRLRAAIEQWAGWQRHRGRADRESHKRFYLATGVDVLSALAQDRQDMERMAGMVEGWCGVTSDSAQKKTLSKP